MVKTGNNNAFTLLELLIVVTLVGILATIALTKYGSVVESARSAEAYAVLAEIASAESSYYVEYNAYTTTWSNLDRYNSAPVSQNFDFSQALNNVSSGYVKAIHLNGKGTVDYYMCVTGGKKGTIPLSCP